MHFSIVKSHNIIHIQKQRFMGLTIFHKIFPILSLIYASWRSYFLLNRFLWWILRRLSFVSATKILSWQPSRASPKSYIHELPKHKFTTSCILRNVGGFLTHSQWRCRHIAGMWTTFLETTLRPRLSHGCKVGRWGTHKSCMQGPSTRHPI
jgi:hypothetical protein